MQSWCSPPDIAGAYVANQLPNLFGNPWSADPSRMAFPFPVEAESFSMPSNDRCRFDDREAITPPGTEPGENNPQDPIGSPKPEPLRIGSLQNHELMAERQDFQLQGSVRSQRGCEGSEHQNQ